MGRMILRSIFLVICLLSVCGAAARAAALQDALPYDDTHAIIYEVKAAPLTPEAAPADEYFGRFKLSNLGIRNIIHDIMIEGNSPLALPKQQSRIQAAESAMADWANKYPRDRWLPGAVVKFAAMLESKQQPFYDQAAYSLWYFLMEHYPNTWFSKYALRQLRGYDEVANIDMVNAPDVHEVSDVIDYFYPRLR